MMITMIMYLQTYFENWILMGSFPLWKSHKVMSSFATQRSLFGRFFFLLLVMIVVLCVVYVMVILALVMVICVVMVMIFAVMVIILAMMVMIKAMAMIMILTTVIEELPQSGILYDVFFCS